MFTVTMLSCSIMASDDGKGFFEYKHRVLFSLFRAAAKAGVRLNVPLDQMVELFQMAYFQEAREHKNLKMTEIAELFGKSLRTVQSLHTRFQGDFFSPENEYEFRRAVAEALAPGPKSSEQLAEIFASRSKVELMAALDDLEQEGRIWKEGETYRRDPEDHDFYTGADTMGRIAGLNRQMDILTETVWNRLLRRKSDVAAGARTYVFAALPEQFNAMIEELFERTRGEILEAEAEAFGKKQTQRHGITIAVATMEENDD